MTEIVEKMRSLAIRVKDQEGNVAYAPIPEEGVKDALWLIGIMMPTADVQRVDVDLINPNTVRDFTVYRLGPYSLLPADATMIVEVANGE